ncbi:hypothetical protein [Moraxella sp. ZY210820]|uniref:hypothetical protein n=1 Tax=unclassified Moraxella TaxID=2685852 RepID=UPI00272F5717|nr:hypothetical protein [Moraxella sp. ZY210820]WLF83448.1 hypothetical protein LU301_09275 [Moraxella sp. ZY210820]
MNYIHYTVLLSLGLSLSQVSLAQTEVTQSTVQTENNRWVDHRHSDVKEWLNDSSNKIDNWFGDIDPSRPASANLRIIVDNQWNEYDDFHSHPRIRGKIKLPTLEKKLSIMIGDDSLDDVSDHKVTVDQHSTTQSKKVIDRTQTRKENTSLALRFSKWNDNLPFDADFDIGLRSHDNPFARLKISKDWSFSPTTGLYTEQTYRYSRKNKNEIRSFWEIYYQQNDNTRMMWQSNFNYQEKSDDDLTWDSSLFRQHQFNQHQRLNYGLQATGYFNSDNAYVKEWDLNRWGAFVSWRQPLWREWFFVQADVNYMNDKRLNRDHYPSAGVRLEMLF